MGELVGFYACMTETNKWVYSFNEADASMRSLLGGKGAGLAEMTNLGIPVPPGFTITTESCNNFQKNNQFPEGMWDQVRTGLTKVEEKMGRKFGDRENPLLVSVRSGAKFSMPGMMDTVLNVGLNDEIAAGLAKQSGDDRFALDSYRRLIQMFGKTVMGIDGDKFEKKLEIVKKAKGVDLDTDLTSYELRWLITEFKNIIAETGEEFPQDPNSQLSRAIGAVFESWNGERAVAYRKNEKIPDDLGTAVNVQAMVFGNLGENSATGVGFTRNPVTGERVLFGEYLTNAQGEDVVAGIRTPKPIGQMPEEFPDIHRQILEVAAKLEQHYGDVQDFEYTVENGKLWMLQTRRGKRSAESAVRIAVDMADEGFIDRQEAVKRIEPKQIEDLMHPRFDPLVREEAKRDGRFLIKGLEASPGAAIGKAVFDSKRAKELGEKGEMVILVRPETTQEDYSGMMRSQGFLTARGGITTHAAVIARGAGKPAVVGAGGLEINQEQKILTVDGKIIAEGDLISIDGGTGEVFIGKMPTIQPKLIDEAFRLLEWADEEAHLQVWANADTPQDAKRAREFGAKGIGLCRTEHMFGGEERLPVIQKMIHAAPDVARLKGAKNRLEKERESAAVDRRAQIVLEISEIEKELAPFQIQYESALAELRPVQMEDFKGILRAMDGFPVVIRLLDPPLHEFVPGDESMQEVNPMLGLRGCRVGIVYPEITTMQVGAAMEAAIELINEGFDPKPKIMIPLVTYEKELAILAKQVHGVAGRTMADYQQQEVDYKVGTMVEDPRAAIIAGRLAEHAEFFSFGTNDLTQTTSALSRDDAGSFLPQYIEQGVISEDPFTTIDREGVGELMSMAIERGRKVRPDLEIGICGEHGGDPASIEFCDELGLDYVSVSPFRVPVARLACAQAALGKDYSTK